MEDLKYNIKEKSECVREIEIQLPWKRIESEIEKVYKDIRKQVQLPGFRKGKVPVKMIKERYAQEAKQEVIERVSPEILKHILEKEEIYPAVRPSIIDYKMEPSKPFELLLKVEVTPQVDPKKYKKLKLVKNIHNVSSEDVDKTLNNLKQQNPQLQTKEGVAEEGDYAVIEFKISRNSKNIDLGSGNRQLLPLGENKFLPGFDSYVVGMEKGDEKEFEYKFPEDYEKQELCGEKAQFKVTLKDLKSKVLPSDKEVAENMGLKDGGELREKISESLKNQLVNSSENQLDNEIVEQILEKNDFEVPPSLIERRTTEMLEQMKNYIKQRGGDPSEIDKKQVQKRAEREIKAGVILGAIAEKEEIKVNKEDIKKQKEEIKKQLGTNDPEQIEQHVNRNAILTGKVFDFVKENAKIKEKEVKAKE